MFPKDTLHIFLSYIVIGIILCVPPYLKWWQQLVGLLNRKEIEGKKSAGIFLIVVGPIILLSLIITHLFQFHKELEVSFWLFFAPASFVVIPFMTAYFGVAAFSRAQGRIGLGDIGVLLFCFGGFGAAGANIHDVLWCARRTEFYTVFWAGGDDLRLWVELFHAPSYDYRVFGFFMFVQVVIALVMAHIIYFRWLKAKNIKPVFAPIGWSWLAMGFLGFAITLIDWPRVISPPLIHTCVVGLSIIIASIFFYRAGKRLGVLIQGAKDSN